MYVTVLLCLSINLSAMYVIFDFEIVSELLPFVSF